MAFHRLASLTDQRSRGGVLLPAADRAAGTLTAFALHGHVSQLRTHTVGAGIDLMVDDDAAADAGAQGQEHGVCNPGGNARNGFRKARNGRIVVDKDGLIDDLLHDLAQGHHVPAQVGAENNHAGLGVGQTGNAHTDGLDVVHGVACILDNLQGEIRHILDDGFRSALQQRGNGILVQDLARFVYQANRNVGAAQINAYINHTELPPMI